ncbi:glycosyltransferase family protein [Brachybacterium huguangmaarense]
MTATRLAIVTGGSAVRYYSHLNQAIFAAEHGFAHRLELSVARDVFSPYWYKFLAIRRTLPDYDWILWMDDDAYFTDWGGHRIEDLLERLEAEDRFLAISEGAPELDGSWTRVNSGVMLLRNDPRSTRLLDLASSAHPSAVREWWDDDRDGMFTDGDQDTIWWALSTAPELHDGFVVTDHRLLNSRAEYYESLDDATIVHFPGPGDKELRMWSFAQRFGLGKELVPGDLLRTYTGKAPRQITRTELAARRVGERSAAAQKRVRRKIDWVRTTGRWR